MKIKLLAAVTFSGAHVDANEEIELPEFSAKALIEEGKAEALEEAPAGDKQALDVKYKGKVPELKEHAKEFDIEFKHDATKAEIIDAIIEAGKVADVLGK